MNVDAEPTAHRMRDDEAYNVCASGNVSTPSFDL